MDGYCSVQSNGLKNCDACKVRGICIEARLRRTINLSAGMWFLFLAMSSMNVIHWAIWIPPMIAVLGVTVSAGIQLNQIENWEE